jgi:hypothetical protein
MQKEERKRTRVEDQVIIEQSSGNVFADLGFKNPEEMLAKAQLAQRFRRSWRPIGRRERKRPGQRRLSPPSHCGVIFLAPARQWGVPGPVPRSGESVGLRWPRASCHPMRMLEWISVMGTAAYAWPAVPATRRPAAIVTPRRVSRWRNRLRARSSRPRIVVSESPR